jgi:hypothetical protein
VSQVGSPGARGGFGGTGSARTHAICVAARWFSGAFMPCLCLPVLVLNTGGGICVVLRKGCHALTPWHGAAPCNK